MTDTPRETFLAELIRRASDGCEGPLDEACFHATLPRHLWCDSCRCQEAANLITRLVAECDTLRAQLAAPTTAPRVAVPKEDEPMRHGGNVGSLPFYVFRGQRAPEYDQGDSVQVWYDDLYDLNRDKEQAEAQLGRATPQGEKWMTDARQLSETAELLDNIRTRMTRPLGLRPLLHYREMYARAQADIQWLLDERDRLCALLSNPQERANALVPADAVNEDNIDSLKAWAHRLHQRVEWLEKTILPYADARAPTAEVFLRAPQCEIERLARQLRSGIDTVQRVEAQLAAREGEIATLTARASKLEDAAFHFQTCRTCRKVGDDECLDGRQFAAYLRGEESA